MRITLIAFAVALGALAGTVQADVLTVPDPVAPVTIVAPGRGDSMAEVTRQFGEPTTKHAPAGGDTRKHPPITRWDYPEFSVFFERKLVIDVVVKGAPMPVQNKDELQPANP